MERLLDQELRIVTGIGARNEAQLEERTIDRLLEVLCRRAGRLVEDRELCERLRPAFRAFVRNVVAYFYDAGELDDYVMTNIMTALITADSHGPGQGGDEDYSTFIRCLNPTDPDAGAFFVIGRAGSVADPECPLAQLEQNSAALSDVPAAQLHVFRAFHYARSQEITRGAPRIPLEAFRRLIPPEIVAGSALEQAFLDVCFSDGAWALYQLELAA